MRRRQSFSFTSVSPPGPLTYRPSESPASDHWVETLNTLFATCERSTGGLHVNKIFNPDSHYKEREKERKIPTNSIPSLWRVCFTTGRTAESSGFRLCLTGWDSSRVKPSAKTQVNKTLSAKTKTTHSVQQ